MEVVLSVTEEVGDQGDAAGIAKAEEERRGKRQASLLDVPPEGDTPIIADLRGLGCPGC